MLQRKHWYSCSEQWWIVVVLTYNRVPDLSSSLSIVIYCNSEAFGIQVLCLPRKTTALIG